MLTDRFGNMLSTHSIAARDAYVEGCDLLFALWPGAKEAFAGAVAEDPNFALAHVAAARTAAGAGDMAGVQTSLAAAKAAGASLTGREAGHLNFFALMLSGQSAAAIAAARSHLGEWPRDAMVVNDYAPIVGLLGMSGRPGLKREQELAMDAFAHHYQGDWWYMAHHAMAISEMGRHGEALELAERSLAARRQNAWAAHSRAHVAYEQGEADGARTFLADWLEDYPNKGGLYGHLAWHLAIAQLGAGNTEAASKLFAATVAPGVHTGHPRTQIVDATQFLCRWELAGNPRDQAGWQALDALAHRLQPKATSHFVDWHIALADAMAGDNAALEARLTDVSAMIRAGRYPEGSLLPDTVRGLAAFARGDYAAAAAVLTPLLVETERLAGSRAQLDLIEFATLHACAALGRHDEMQHVLAARRPGPVGIPVASVY